MSHKTKAAALKKFREYRTSGFVFQYVESQRWNWATAGSPIGEDLLAGNILNRNAPSWYRIPVTNVEWVD